MILTLQSYSVADRYVVIEWMVGWVDGLTPDIHPAFSGLISNHVEFASKEEVFRFRAAASEMYPLPRRPTVRKKFMHVISAPPRELHLSSWTCFLDQLLILRVTGVSTRVHWMQQREQIRRIVGMSRSPRYRSCSFHQSSGPSEIVDK